MKMVLALMALSSLGHAAAELSPFTGEPLPPPSPTAAPAAPPPSAPAPAAPSVPTAPPPTPAPPGYWIPAPDGRSYVQVPPGYQAPFELPYRAGEPVPIGYQLVEQPRRGLVVPGYLLSIIGYAAGVFGAAAADFANHSSWMLMPVIGPWLTLGARDYDGCERADADNDGSTDYDAECTQDGLVITGLIMDGMMQTAGVVLLLVGNLATKKKLIRNDIGLELTPASFGSGYGLAARGVF